MKRILFSISMVSLLMGFAVKTQAQSQPNPVFAETFETMSAGTTFPAGWLNMENSKMIAWMVGDKQADAHTGSRYAVIYMHQNADGNLPSDAFYGNPYKNNTWLITSGFQLTAGTDYSVTFWVKKLGGTTFEDLGVYIGKSAKVDSMSVLWQSGDYEVLSWKQVRVRFKPTETGTYHLGFNDKSRIANNVDMYIWVDDIAVYEAPEYDLALEQMPFQYTRIPVSQNLSLPVNVRNSGQKQQTDIVVSAFIGGSPVKAAPFTLPPGESKIVNLSIPVSFGANELKTITAVSAQASSQDTLGGISFTGTINTQAQDDAPVNSPKLISGTFGQIYEITDSVTLSQIILASARAGTEKSDFSISLYRMKGDTLEPDAMFTHPTSAAGEAWHYINVPKTLLVPGRYFLAINQSTTGLVFTIGGDANKGRCFYTKERNRLMPWIRPQHPTGRMPEAGGLGLRMVFEVSDCAAPSGLAVEAGGSGSAKFSWDDLGAAQYIVRWSDGTKTDSMIANTNSVSILDRLRPGASYTWSVTVKCDAEHTSATVNGEPFNTANCTNRGSSEVIAAFPFERNFDADDFLCWDQEVVRKSNAGDSVFWKRNNGPLGGRPGGRRLAAAIGGESLAISGANKQTGAVTRLLSPRFNLSSWTNNPVLKIAHVQGRFVESTYPQDSLLVYYRIGNGAWNLLATIGDALDEYTDEVIGLPSGALADNCQFAFEAIVKDGWGIAIDLLGIDSVRFRHTTYSPGKDNYNVGVTIHNKVIAGFSRPVVVADSVKFKAITIKDQDGNEFQDIEKGVAINRGKVTVEHLKFRDTTVYTVHIPAGAFKQSDADVVWNEDITWSFETGLDEIAVAVNGVRPANNSDKQNTNTEIWVKFDANQVRLIEGGLSKITINPPVEGGITPKFADSTITIEHGQLDPNTKYTVTIPEGVIERLKGHSWSFITGGATVTAATRIPTADATNIPVNTTVSITYNGKIKATEENLARISILNVETGESAGGVSATISGSTVTIAHNDFAENTEYVVTVPIYTVGNSSETSFTFKTGSKTTAIAPDELETGVVIYPNPSNGVVNVIVPGKSTVNVFDILGRLVNTYRVDTELQFSQKPGVYFIHVEHNGAAITKKLIVR